jgi:uracil-DNA glycosylase
MPEELTGEPNDATPFLPERRSLKALREAGAGCRGCHLWRRATQTVFGEGSPRSRVMFVGEQPGDREDRAGKPFVGPAGRELDRALEAVGLDRKLAYVTNVVKALDSDLAPLVFATIHPSAILRAPDDESRQLERRTFTNDLRVLVEALT